MTSLDVLTKWNHLKTFYSHLRPSLPRPTYLKFFVSLLETFVLFLFGIAFYKPFQTKPFKPTRASIHAFAILDSNHYHQRSQWAPLVPKVANPAWTTSTIVRLIPLRLNLNCTTAQCARNTLRHTRWTADARRRQTLLVLSCPRPNVKGPNSQMLWSNIWNEKTT